MNPLFEDVCKPYSDEMAFYIGNNIPLWECKTHQTVELGKIYEREGSYIIAKVNAWPAQFWTFKVFCSSSNKYYEISTGSGGLSKFFPFVQQIADNMISIDSIK